MAENPRWADYATPKHYQAGEYVFRENDPGDTMYMIEKGQVAVIKGADTDAPLVLGYRSEGDLIGEVSLLGDSPRSASVLALKPTTLLAINHDDFWRLFEGDAAFRRMVLQALIDRLLAADQSRVRAAAAEHELFERLASLSSEAERLAQIMQLRQETVGFIIHDLRNPLTLISMALAMLELDPSLQLQEETTRFLAMASGGAQRMQTLVEALLDVERLEGGEAELELESLDVLALLSEIVERLKPMAWASRINLGFNPPAGPLPAVRADRQRIDRVLTNLIDNALKYTPLGGQVTVSAWSDGEAVFVAVNDNGPGIRPEYREHVFDRFAQVEARRQGSRGFGLGLAYCRSAINAHGGKIWAEEGEGGVGTRFVFWLPAAPME